MAPGSDREATWAAAPRRGILSRLLWSFLGVLVPLLVVTFLAFGQKQSTEERAILDVQLRTAQAMALQLDATFAAAAALGQAVVHNPVVERFEPAELDPLLQDLATAVPTIRAIYVFDERGLNRGWGDPTSSPEPRLNIADREFFQQALATGKPVLSPVLELRRPKAVGVIMSVPLRDGRGAANVLVDIAELRRALVGLTVQPDQVMVAADPTGRMAIHGAETELTYDDTSAFATFWPLHSPAVGRPVTLASFVSPLMGDERLGAFVRSPAHGWVVGVSRPRGAALARAREELWRSLLGLGALAAVGVALSFVVARRIARPVGRLVEHVQAIQRGELAHRSELQTGDELEGLGLAFDGLAAHLQAQAGELRRTQQELVRRERLAACGEMAAVVAHELRNPLAVVQNSIALLERGDPTQSAELLAVLREEANRMDELIRDLVDFTRQREPELASTDVVAVVRSAVDVTQVETGRANVGEDLPSALPPVQLDARLVRQAVVNLVRNAVQAAGAAGRVTVRLRLEAAGAGHAVVIDVEDDGPGVPEADRARVFEPFFTTKAIGSGLGLAIVKRVAEDHGGSVGLSCDGVTRFTLRIPVAVAREAPRPA